MQDLNLRDIVSFLLATLLIQDEYFILMCYYICKNCVRTEKAQNESVVLFISDGFVKFADEDSYSRSCNIYILCMLAGLPVSG